MLKQLMVAGLALGSALAIATTAQAEEGFYGQIIEDATLGEGFKAGDFTIQRSGSNTKVGNGVDEMVTWMFNFREDHDLLDAFLNDESSLQSAQLTFSDIVVSDKLITTDELGIPGYRNALTGGREDISWLKVPDIVDVPGVGETFSFTIDLMDYEGFDSNVLMSAFLSDKDHVNHKYKDDWAGEESDYTITNKKYALPFFYMDDALIGEAQLVLSKGGTSISATASKEVDVPEPAAMAGLAVAGASLLLSRRKQQTA